MAHRCSVRTTHYCVRLMACATICVTADIQASGVAEAEQLAVAGLRSVLDDTWPRPNVAESYDLQIDAIEADEVGAPERERAGSD